MPHFILFTFLRTAGYIEALAAKVGIPHPGLTSEQAEQQIVRSTKLLVQKRSVVLIALQFNFSNTILNCFFFRTGEDYRNHDWLPHWDGATAMV